MAYVWLGNVQDDELSYYVIMEVYLIAHRTISILMQNKPGS